jgi:glycosyltransferase involved in cell wall biosynthesis
LSEYKKSMNNALISVVIPAYNLPEYTEKTIDSIISQTYRPIEIVISDDNSPINLKSLVEAKKYKCDAGINIKYFRQEINLGYYWNLQFVINEAVGKYLVLLDHDDWLIDPDFFSEAVKAMDGKPDCFLSICNTLPEKTPYPFMDIYYENWHYVNSGKFIKNNLFSYNKIHPSRSAVMMRFDKLRELDYKNYFIDNASAKSMKIQPDEAFVLILLLSSLGSIALSGRIVSVRGEPIGSLSTSSEWGRDSGCRSFAQYFLLYEYFKKINWLEGVDAMLEHLINYQISAINIEMLRYLKFKKLAIIFMATSCSQYYINRLFLVPIFLLGKLKNTIRNSLTFIVSKIFKF